MTGVDRAHFVSGDENPETDAFVESHLSQKKRKVGHPAPGVFFCANLADDEVGARRVCSRELARGIEVLAHP